MPALIALTLAGSVIGAFLLLLMPVKSVSLIVSAAMIGVAVFSVIYRKANVAGYDGTPSKYAEIAGYALTFLLGIYGGFFSGGYVTILISVYVAFFKQSFIEAIATTKLMNIFSSSIATGIFMMHGLVNYKLGLILGATMLAGVFLRARVAMRIGDLWLRRIFLAAVWILGFKVLLFDVLLGRSGGSFVSHSASH